MNLLAACARPSLAPLDDGCRERLRRFFEECDQVAAVAESHGLAPLLYAHAHRASIPMAPDVKLALQALTIRHRWASAVRSEVLAEIVVALGAAEIDVLVLKGAALAHTVYADPGLRPMRDIDILVRQGDAVRAQHTLVELGFKAAGPSEVNASHKHMPPASRRTKDMMVSVEVHHDLNEPYMGWKPADFAGLYARRRPFEVGGATVATLGPTDMLAHLCQHGTYLLEPLKLKWCADVIGVADRFVEEIDWPWLRRHAPKTLGTVAMFGCLTPLSELARAQMGGHLHPSPQAVGVDFDGWPRVSRNKLKTRGWSQRARDTLFPGEWWLRLHYGVGMEHSILATRWIRHPLNVFTWPARVMPVMREWSVPGWYRSVFWRQ